MPYDDGNFGWPDYVSVAERRKRAARAAAELVRKGEILSPVVVIGRAIAGTFWGKSWCSNLESYQDFANRLERGRSYVRNGLVIDLQIAPREVNAIVSGSSIYRVSVSIDPVAEPRWRAICEDCAGGIDSLVELLQGRLSQSVMERICRQGQGLFPEPSGIRFKCSCPDYASMCKHVAAVLYGIGTRLDTQPELLFRLRSVEANDLLAGLNKALPLDKGTPSSGKLLESDDLSAMFGLEMAKVEVPVLVVSRGKAIARKSPPSSVPGSPPAKVRSNDSKRQKPARRRAT